MSRLTEYLPELTGVVFEEDSEYEKMRQAILGGGTAKPTTGGTTGGTTAKPATKDYYEQQSESNKGKPGIFNLAQLSAMPGARQLDANTIELKGGERYAQQPGTGDWFATSSSYHSQRDNARYEAGTPLNAGAGGAPGAGGTTGVLPGVRSGVSPEARQFGEASSSSLPNSAGVSIPGWDAYRQPGIGIPDTGARQQLTDRTSLNSMQAGRQGSATQFPVAPGFRGAGQTGNNINFAGTGAVGGNSQLASQLEPQMLFGPTTASVPGTYVQGQGNVGDSNRAYALPFNIGPGGAALANVAGNNVQVNGPPGSGVGYGFALNAMPASNVGDLTGRNLNDDPALQAMQILQLNSAIAQGRMGDLMATNPNQFGGNRAGTANGPFSGNGGMYGQGNFWGGYTPDPLGATPPVTPGAGGGLPEGYQSSASNLFSGGSYMGGGGGGGGGAAPYQSSASSLFGSGGAGYMGGRGTAPGAAANIFGGGGYMGGGGAPGPAAGAGGLTGSLLGNVQNSLAPAPSVAGGLPPPGGVAPAAAPSLLAQLQAQRDEEERGGRGGGAGYGEDGGTRFGMSRGGNVYTGLPGFADGGGVKTVNPTTAAPPIDAALTGSLAGSTSGGGAAAGPGAAVQTTPTTSTNPAANAIQPVQGPQSTTAIVPTAAAASAGPVQTQTPAWTSQPQSGLDLGILNQFNSSVAKQAQQDRLRQTFSNRWEAANLAGPTAIQLQPGQAMPTEGLPPGAYYDISEALKSLMGDIKGSQTELAGLGEIGDPEQIMAYLSGLEVEQSPYQKAQDIKLQLAGLGAGGQGDTAGLMQQQEALKQQMGPLGTILGAQEKRTALGERMNMEGLGAQVVALEDAIQGAQAQSKRAGELQTKQRQQGLNHAEALELYNMVNLGDPAEMEVRLFNLKHQLSQAEGQNNAIDEAERTITNLLAQAGLTPDQAASQLGLYGAQMDQLKQAYNAAMQGETYRQQMASLIGNKDPTAELGRIGALIGKTKTDYGNVEKARQLNNRITNLAARGSALPGFAKGGNWIAGATSNSHGQFRAKAKSAGMSTKAYASKMSGAGGRTGKQARLAKTLMSFAGGGDMTTEEPIIGVGMFSGRPRFQVGEPQYPGGPPMAERLSITPLNRPALPMGRMRSAA